MNIFPFKPGDKVAAYCRYSEGDEQGLKNQSTEEQEESDRLRLSIIEVLQNEKSTTDELRDALSLFIHSVVIYPESRVLICHTLPGFAKVASTTSGEVTAPPEGVEPPTS